MMLQPGHTPKVAARWWSMAALVLVGGLLSSCSRSIEDETARIQAANLGVGTYVGGTFHASPEVSIDGQLIGPVRELQDGRIVGFEYHEDEENPTEIVVRESVTATENLTSYRGPEFSQMTPSQLVVVSDRWVMVPTRELLVWWDLEHVDLVHSYEFDPDHDLYPEIALLSPTLVRVGAYRPELTRVIDLESATVRDFEPTDYAYLSDKLTNPRLTERWRLGWQIAYNDHEVHIFNESFTQAGSWPAKRNRTFSQQLYPDGGLSWFKGAVPGSDVEYDEEGSKRRETLYVTHPLMDYEVVGFDLEAERNLRELYDRAYLRTVTGDGRLVLGIDDQLMFWAPGEGPTTVELPSDGKVHMSSEGFEVENHVAFFYTLDDGRLLTVEDNGGLTTWDLTQPIPTPTAQFTIDWEAKVAIASSREGSVLPELEVTSDGHVIIQPYWKDERTRTHYELEIVKLASTP